MKDYSPIKKQRVSDIIVDKISHSIKNGDLKPGEKLPSERELSNYFSVSRGAVREAISVLEAKGILEVRPGVGVFVIETSGSELFRLMNEMFRKKREQLIEVLELRQGVEAQAAYLAAQRRTQSDLEEMKRRLNLLEEEINKGGIATKEDFDFHFAIFKASHNSMMIHTLQLISEAYVRALNEGRTEALLIPGKTRMVFEEHKIIYDAIKRSEPEEARNVAVRHIENHINQIAEFERLVKSE